MPDPSGLGIPGDDEFGLEISGEVEHETPITWPAATAAVMVTLIVIGGVVLVCMTCFGVFGGRFK